MSGQDDKTIRFKRTDVLGLSPTNGPEKPRARDLISPIRDSQSCFSARDRPSLLVQTFKFGQIQWTVVRFWPQILLTMSQTVEAFPELITSTQNHKQQSSDSEFKGAMPRSRRKSSGLGADIRGDTGAPAVSTLEPMPRISSPPLSPVSTVNSASCRHPDHFF